jgi:putative DNA methylase
MTVRPLIEQWFPAAMVGAESLRERTVFTDLPPLFALHVWWARRPLITSRPAVVASLLPAWPDDFEAATDVDAGRVLKALLGEFPRGEQEYRAWFVHALGIFGDPVGGRKRIAAARETGEQLDDGGYGYKRAFTVNPDTPTIDRFHRLVALRGAIDRSPTVLDLFAGGGSIPLEAARFGCTTVANELNPVAAAILHGTVELPGELGPDFASVIEHWGTRWAKRVERRLAPYFPKQPNDASIAGYIWAHTVPCPSTGRPTPLAPDFWVARGKAGRDVAVRLEADLATGTVTREIVEGKGAAQWGDRSTYKQGAGTSIWSGETFGGDYIRAQAAAGRVGEMLLAVSVTRVGRTGRHFRAPSDDDLHAVEAAAAETARHLSEWEIHGLIPTEAIPPGHKTNEPRRMSLVTWRQLFTHRQLLVLATAVDELRTVTAEARSELIEREAKAVGLYLAFAIDKTTDYNSRLSSWDATRIKVRNTFDRHDFSFKWTFAEFDGASAMLPWAVTQMVRTYKGIATLAQRPATMLDKGGVARTRIHLGSATDLPLADGSVDAIITDPPYYDNVMYGELADYFYVWLKRSLRDTWPELCTLELSDKEGEAVANPSLFDQVATRSGRGKTATGKSAVELADDHYEELLTRSFREAHRVLKADGVMTVMFTHKRVDAWDTLGQALLEAGFSVNSSWPVHTESEYALNQAKKNAASSTILLTCRKRGSTAPAYWADIRGRVADAAHLAAAELSADGLVGIDLTLATFGPVLSVLSRNWPVFSGELGADGSPQLLRPDVALDLAREEVARLKKRGLLGGRDVNFDRVTDWWLLAWNDFQAAEFPSGEALKLSIATHLDLDDLAKRHKVIRATSGTVTLLSPAQRRTAHALDPQAASWLTELDALHALMVIYDEDGLGAAREWLIRTGKGEDRRFADLVEAAIRAIPRVKEKGEFVRPEARTLEGLRATLFDEIQPPTEPGLQPEQLSLG